MMTAIGSTWLGNVSEIEEANLLVATWYLSDYTGANPSTAGQEPTVAQEIGRK